MRRNGYPYGELTKGAVLNSDAMMECSTTYTIILRGQVLADELNAAGPLAITVDYAAAQSAAAGRTRLTARTDQSGLVGLIRYLHGLGYVLLAISLAGEETDYRGSVEQNER